MARRRPERAISFDFHSGPFWQRPTRNPIEGSGVCGYNCGTPSQTLTTAMSKADVYRKRAAEYQRQADAAELKSVRKTLRDVADKYLALADNEERSEVMLGSSANGRATPSPDAHD
jgi:hypothetical protein